MKNKYDLIFLAGFNAFIAFLQQQDKIKTGKDLVPGLHYEWFFFLEDQKSRIDCCLRSSDGFFPVVKPDIHDAIMNIEYTPSIEEREKYSWTPEKSESFVVVYNHKLNSPITEDWEKDI